MARSMLAEVLLFPIKAIWFVFRIILFSGIILGGWFFLQMFGFFPVQVPVSGASMLPTLPEEGFVEFQRYIPDTRLHSVFPQAIKRGDIVVFENDKTDAELKKQKKDESGFVKRVVGVEGDSITIRNGFVYVNGNPVEEKYILKPRSTFGGTTVRDCQEIKVPKGKLFVLGDNRKVSLDSRQLGVIDISDIQYYIPYEKQPERFASKWRDATHDLDVENDSLFDVTQYVELLNGERRKNKLGDLKYQSKLEESARLRAQAMLRYDDFDFDAPKSGYTMEDAMADAGYSNVVYGEFPMTGYYDTQELFDSFLEHPNSTKFLLNEDYEEIGVSTFVGELNGCPVQVVVQHLAGFIPPNYGEGEISSWEEGLKRLKDVAPGWQKLKESVEFYNEHKSDVDRMDEIISTRISRMEQIVARMKKNEWFTTEEKQWIEQDDALGKEQNNLAEKINNTQ